MYKKTTISIITALISIISFCQSPQNFSYQSLVKDGSGNVVQDKSIGVQISILEGSVGGSAVYTETHTATSNSNGLISLSIGDGTVTTGSFNTIDWTSGTYYIKSEFDLDGGTSYSLSTTSQLLSVPYALFANEAANAANATNAENATNATNATNAEYVAAENLPTSYPELNIEDSLVIGNNGIALMGIVEVTGTTDASDNYIEVNFPAGYDNTNSCVLSAQILTEPFMGSSTKYGLGYSGSDGTISYQLKLSTIFSPPPLKPIISKKIRLNYPSELRDKEFSVILMKHK